MNCWAVATLMGLAGVLGARVAEEPPLPPGALARLGDTRYRHTEGEAAALSPDGRWLALTTPASVTVWDLLTGRPAYRLAGPGQVHPRKRRGAEPPPLVAAVFTPDGKHLLTVDDSGPVRVWDAATGRPVRAVSPPEKKAVPALAGRDRYRGKVTEILQGPGGARLLVRSDDLFVFALNPSDWSLSYRCLIYRDILAVSGDGRRLVEHYRADATYEEFEVLDTVTAGSVFADTIPGGVGSAALSADGRLLAASGPRTRLWDLKSKTEIELADPAPPAGTGVGGLVFTGDGKTLRGTGYGTGAVVRWDTATGKLLSVVRLTRVEGNSGFVSADGKLLAAAGADRVIRRFDLTTGKELPCGDGFTGHVAAALAPDGKSAACGDRLGMLRVWAAPFIGPPRTLRRTGPAVDELTFSADGKRLFAAHPDRSVGVWDPAAGKEVIILRPPHGVKGRWYDPPTRIAVSADGRRVVCSVNQAAVWAWDLATGRVAWDRRADARGEGVTDCRPVFTTDGAEVLVGGRRAEVVRLDPATGRELDRFPVPGVERWDVNRLAVSPDGRRVAAHTAYNDGRLVLIDRDTGRVWWKTAFPWEQGVTAVTFTPSGAWLVTAHADGRLRVLEAATGKPAFERANSARYIHGVQLSADGRLAVTDARGATALVWSLEPEEPAGPSPKTGVLWEWLAGEDAAQAYRAAWLLAGRLNTAAGAEDVRERLPPDKGPDPAARLPGLLADLDSPKFAARVAASRELTALLARYPALWDRLRSTDADALSAEAKKRLQRVLEKTASGTPTPTDIQRARVLAAAELAGTPAARKLLAEWAAGIPLSPLTREAKAALARLNR